MEQLITVATFNEREPADQIATRLKQAGLDAEVYDESHEQKWKLFNLHPRAHMRVRVHSSEEERAHAILSDSRWQGADLTKLVDDELAPYRSEHADRIRVTGPNVLLDPTTAQTLALALHELATNAAKYGALSQASGKLELEWAVQPKAIFVNWRETDGPSTYAPDKTGFGTRIITSSVERQLGGKATFDWRPEGLSCVLVVPRSQNIGPRRGTATDHGADASPRAIYGERIMIVEDEALVAMILEDQLQEIGLSTVATCASVAEAMKAIDRIALDAAILDVNLGGQLVYPVADRLMDLSIPFVFVTGYGRESIDRRYDSIHVLEKPVEREALEAVFARAPPASLDVEFTIPHARAV